MFVGQHCPFQLRPKRLSLRKLMPSIEQRVAQIFAARQITRTDQDFLMAIFAGGKISAEDEALINKIYEALNAGRLRVVK